MKRLRNSIEFKGTFCEHCSQYVDIPGIQEMSVKCPKCGEVIGAKENKNEEIENPNN